VPEVNARSDCASNRSNGKIQFASDMSSSLLKYLITVCMFSGVTCISSINAAAPGFVEGHIKIVSPKEVNLADDKQPVITSENYSEYPLVILSQGGKKEVARITADGNGNYHTALPPGDYVLDVQGRAPGHVRAKPQAFTIVSNHTVHVDMDIDTGVR
jgi:hypothetical protein